jgi:hypothetical protein
MKAPKSPESKRDTTKIVILKVGNWAAIDILCVEANAEHAGSLILKTNWITLGTNTPTTYAPSEKKNTFPKLGIPVKPYSRFRLSDSITYMLKNVKEVENRVISSGIIYHYPYE